MPNKRKRSSTGSDHNEEKDTPCETDDGFTNDPPPEYNGCTFSSSDDSVLDQMTDEQIDGYIKNNPLYTILYLRQRSNGYPIITVRLAV